MHNISNKETRLKIAQLESEILDLIDDASPSDISDGGEVVGMSRSDLQGIIEVIVSKIYQIGVSREGLSFEEALQMHKNEFAAKFR